MAAIKQGLLKHPGRSLVGDIYSIDIGIKDIAGFIEDQLPEMIDEALISSFYPKRPDDGHKGTFGTCFVLAGSPNYAGAAYLTGKAAYEAGCGLVRILTQKIVQQALAGDLVEAVWTVLPSSNGAYDTEGINKVKAAILAADSLVIGPGWGLSEENILFLEQLLEIFPNDLPVVIDADGLKLLKQIGDWPRKLPENTILTPHPGEMSELTGLPIAEIQENRWDYVKKFAVQWKVTLILKGAVTAISTSEGELFVNPISDSALATAGSGDVLTGVLGGLLAQGVKVIEAALLGTWLHSSSGKTAHEKIGTDVSVTALDILNALGTGFINRK
jgi:NAD(P)H-hydrate epimerase